MGDVVDLVINNFEPFSHPFHMHGHGAASCGARAASCTIARQAHGAPGTAAAVARALCAHTVAPARTLCPWRATLPARRMQKRREARPPLLQRAAARPSTRHASLADFWVMSYSPRSYVLWRVLGMPSFYAGQALKPGILRDTDYVPALGYTVIRFIADNPGESPWHW